ncbi:MAG: hypothetical protein DMG97_31180 [Acidobacteria bacterium]|nr:MAG: hypothetical protein DMG97_31180 [Acidobacteriota bacterium]
MVNNPGATRELSTATIVKVTGEPLSVPEPASVTVCVPSSKVTEVICVDCRLTPEPGSLKDALNCRNHD